MKRLILLVSMLLSVMLISAQDDAIRTISLESASYRMTVSADGSMVATFEDGVIHNHEIISEYLPIRIFDVATGEELHTLTGHMDYAYGAAFTTDGTLLATAHEMGWIYIWDTASGELVKRIHAMMGSGPIAFLPDSKILAVVNNSNQFVPSVLLWDIDSEAIISILAQRFETRADFADFLDESMTNIRTLMAMHVTGDRLIFGNVMDEVLVWDIATGDETVIYDPGLDTPYFSIRHVDYVPESGSIIYSNRSHDEGGLLTVDATMDAPQVLATEQVQGMDVLDNSVAYMYISEDDMPVVAVIDLDTMIVTAEYPLMTLDENININTPFFQMALTPEHIILGGFVNLENSDNIVVVIERE